MCVNVANATAAARELMRRGFAPLCPQFSCFLHYAGGFFGYTFPEATSAGFTHDEYLEVDLPWVAAADAVLRLPGESIGADRETEFANLCGIPVYDDIGVMERDFERRDEVPLPEEAVESPLTETYVYAAGFGECHATLPDSGKREDFTTGSVRDSREGKGRFDLLPPRALKRLAVHFERGARKYGDRNWEKGQPLQRFIDSTMRHLTCWQAGRRDEDHLIAAAWNLLAHVETQERIDAGELPAVLDDFPWATEEDAE